MIVAIIPARGNSKGIEGKNLTEVGDKPLLQYTLEAATDSGLIDYVIVSSEDGDIIHFSKRFLGLEDDVLHRVYQRPHELSQDHVQVDEVALYALRQISLHDPESYPDTVVVLQPTSPFRTGKHIDEAIERYQLINDGTHAWEKKKIVFSAHEPSSYTYESSDGEEAKSWHGDPRFRLGRQQEHDVPYAVENGAIYVVDAKLFSRQRSFRAPTMYPYWMDKWESLQVDEPLDLYIANCLMGNV